MQSPGHPVPVPPAGEMDHALLAKMAHFCALLRQHGFGVGLGESQDAMSVAGAFLCTDFPAFQGGMRALMCTRPGERETFDRLFEGFWCPADGTRRISQQKKPRPRHKEPEEAGLELTLGWDDLLAGEEMTRTTSGANRAERLLHTDFSQIAPEDQPLLDALARRLWKRMALRLNRRLEGARNRQALHFRRTIRRNLSHGGEPVELVLRGRRPRKPRLVVVLDVSGSMELYSFTFLRLLHALQGAFRRVHSFIFSTRLEEVTTPLDTGQLGDALAAVARLRLGWNGGTRIGESLGDLVDLHGGRVLRRDTLVLVLSDGLDTGEPEDVGRALERIRLACRGVIWLNPLLGLEGYQPLARGMASALPHLKVFAPAHNLASLLQLEGFMVNSPKSW